MEQSGSWKFFSRKRTVNELLHFKGDDSGYIEGKVFMTWPPRNKQHRINLEVAEDSDLYRFEVEILHKEGIAFRPHERVCIALKGVKVVQRKESSAPHCFPIVLRFPDGVILKYLSGVNAGKVVDAWEGNTDEWYNPGVVRTISDAVAIDTICHAPVSPIAPQTAAPSCRAQDLDASRPPPSLISMSEGAATALSIRPIQQPNTERPGHSSKARRRKKRKLLKEKEVEVDAAFPKQLIVDKLPPTDVTTSCQEKPEPPFDPSRTNVSGNHSQPHLLSGGANTATSIPEDSGIEISRASNIVVVPEEAGVSVPRPKAGVRTQRGDIYSSLSELQKGPSMVNVIGIVVHATPERKTTRNEWCRSITLVDPSTVDSSSQGITVNCFQKKHPEWLPQVQKDDVVILRKLKVVEYRGVIQGTGYGDKLRWAVYDPLEHSIRPPKKGNAPEKELIDDGMGYEYSPYWKPFQDSTEVEYCREIGEWWKAMRIREGDTVSAVQCSKVCRQHLLISEASPDRPPQGFFDCTVEVLQKFSNDYGPTTVYVTDYTVNAMVPPVRAAWCPPQLADRALRCSMWDSAGEIAKLMNPGEYWYLHNARVKWNNHYMEGTMQLAEKVTQLDETKLKAQPFLKALLARKKEFEIDSGSTSGLAPMHLFPEMLLQDVEETTNFLTCIVELLHTDFNSCDGHFLYVTDYTYNPNLPTTVSAAVWAHNLDHRVVKIKLDDAQVKNLLDLAPGNVYIVRNMRVRYSGTSGGIHGCLGGDDTLVISLHDLSSHQAQQLQRNKEKWERENMLNAPAIMETDLVLKQSSTVSGNTALHEGVAGPAPNDIKVLARVMDFFPFSLEDACVLRCTNCNSCLLPSRNNCPRCDDMLKTHCKWFYRLCVLLQDDKGNEYVVSLSEKRCTLLQDVGPTNFRSDQIAFHKFLEKLDPILGNLRDVHLAWSENKDKVIESPLVKFTLESWDIDDEKGYGLLHYTSSNTAI